MGAPLIEIEEVYHAALGRKPGKERAEFLDAACGQDSAVRSQVEALLEAHEEAGDFLEAPIGEGAEATLTGQDRDNPQRPEGR